MKNTGIGAGPAAVFFGCIALVLILVFTIAGTTKHHHKTASAQSKQHRVAARPRAVWHDHCVPALHFCAQYPSVSGQKPGYRKVFYDSATSVTGKAPAYVSSVYRSPHTRRICVAVRCSLKDTENDYIVEVFKSKYPVPWTALTALNGGTLQAVRGTKSGYPAVHFTPGLYGATELAVYARGRVYYVYTVGQDRSGRLAGAHNWDRFLGSFRIVG